MSRAGQILHVTDKGPGSGGIAQTIARYRDIAQDAGWESRVLRLVPMPTGPDQAPLHFSHSREVTTSAAQALKQAVTGADLIHLHLGFTALSPAMIAVMAEAAPVVVSLHDVSFACANGLPQGREAAKAYPDGAVRSALRSALQGRFKDSARTLGFTPARLAVRRALQHHAAAILAPSRYLEEQARAVGFDHITCLPHAVPLSDPVQPGPAQCAARVLYMGRLCAQKGAMLALETMAHVPSETELAFAGAGPLEAELRARAAQMGVAGRVQFHGWCGPKALAAQLAQARVVVQPSFVPEGFGLSVIEAAMAGRACVTLRRGAHAELDFTTLDPTQSAPAIRATPSGVAERLTPYLLDAGYAQAQGRLARERAGAFDPHDQAETLMALYQRLGGFERQQRHDVDQGEATCAAFA